MTYLKNLFGLNDNGFFSPLAWIYLRENWLFLILALLLSLPTIGGLKGWLGRRGPVARLTFNTLWPILLAGIYGLSLIYLLQYGGSAAVIMPGQP